MTTGSGSYSTNDKLRGVARLRQRFGDDEGDAVADRAHPAAAQYGTERPETLGTAHVLGHHRHKAAELVVFDVGAGQHGDDAIGGLGFGCVDALNARVRVRRHNHHAIQLLRQVDIVDIAAPTGDEAGVLKAGNRLSDTEFCHVLPPRHAAII